MNLYWKKNESRKAYEVVGPFKRNHLSSHNVIQGIEKNEKIVLVTNLSSWLVSTVLQLDSFIINQAKKGEFCKYTCAWA